MTISLLVRFVRTFHCYLLCNSRFEKTVDITALASIRWTKIGLEELARRGIP